MKLQKIIQDICEKEIYVYGGGLAGKMVSSWLQLHDIQVNAIVVSDGHKEIEEYITLDKEKIKVLEFSNVQYKNISDVLFLNTVVSGKDSVEELLKKNQLSFYDDFYENIPEIEKEYAQYYYKKIGLDISDDILKFGEVKVYNPCKVDESFSGSLIGTMGDDILPLVYNEFSLTIDGAYERGNVYCKQGDIVIDAGAHAGIFACYAANKGCKVYACEPDQRAIKVLKQQQKLYPENIEIIEKGLWDKCGQISFYESDNSEISSICMPRGKVEEHIIDVITIDELIDSNTIPRIDYIKADIEGAERNLLRGAKKTLKMFAPKLSICTYHFPEDKTLLEEIIKEANPEYVVEYQWRKLYAYVPGRL